MPVNRSIFDDPGEGDVFHYTHPEIPGRVFTSNDLDELTSAERRRLQRQDPKRPWLVDGAMPRQVNQNPLADLRRDVYIRDRFRCQGCGRQFVSDETLARDDFEYDGLHNIHGLTLGHIIPKSKQGPYSMENIKAQCKPCNNRLGDKVWADFIEQEKRMAATLEQIKRWYEQGDTGKYTHMIVARDWFDNENYPVYVKPDESAAAVADTLEDATDECYSYALGWESQAAEVRARHWN